MNRYVSDELRRRVITRAAHLCEYCLIDIEDAFFGGDMDHIVSVKHGGITEADISPTPANLATETKGAISGQCIGHQVNWCGSFIRALITGQTILRCTARASNR